MTDILVVEDNVELAQVLCDFLVREGYKTEHVDNGEDAVVFVESNRVKLVLLDVMLPGIDGFGVCKLIREKFNVPIIIVSAKVAKDDKLNGLLLGADDYVEKPYDIDILLAKINAVYRRNYDANSMGNIITEGNLKINTSARTVAIDGNVLNFTAKEYELLLLLINSKGKVLGKEQMFDKIWGVDSFSEPSTLTVHIKWIREKIEKNPKKPIRILTVWGVGYRFEG